MRLWKIGWCLLLLGVFGGCAVTIGEGDRVWNEYVAADRHEADVGGYKLHYIDVGRGEPVVMIHGYADSSYTWHRNVRELAEAGFRVIAVDQPGLGRSEIPPEPFTFAMENMAREILDLTDRLGLQTFHVVGSSMGGGIALFLAARYPERIRKVAVFDPACYPMHNSELAVLSRREGTRQFVADIAGRWAGWYALREVYDDDAKVTAALVDEYARPLNKPGYRRLLARLLAEYFSRTFSRMGDEYPSIEAPVLIVWGVQDKWVDPAFADRLHLAIPGSQLLMVDHCGHLPHQEQPEIVNPRLLEFLKTD